MTEFRSDPNKNMRDDMDRNVNPDSLADLGYEVPSHMLSDDSAPGAEDSFEATEPQVEDRLDASPTRQLGRLTIAQAQENARRHRAQHHQRRGEERRINLPNPE
jgi:hypothetical protein